VGSQQAWKLRISPDARESLIFLVGLVGLAAMIVAHLIWQRAPEPLLVGVCLAMSGVSLGVGLDRKARERRGEPSEPLDDPWGGGR
jgi:hypothetical protein